jgi:hypothetical protein
MRVGVSLIFAAVCLETTQTTLLTPTSGWIFPQIVLQAVVATAAGMVVLNYCLRCKRDPWYLKLLIAFMSMVVVAQMTVANVEWAALIRESRRMTLLRFGLMWELYAQTDHRDYYETLYNQDLISANLLWVVPTSPANPRLLTNQESACYPFRFTLTLVLIICSQGFFGYRAYMVSSRSPVGHRGHAI